MNKPVKRGYLWYIPQFKLYVVTPEKYEKPSAPAKYIGPVSYTKLDEISPQMISSKEGGDQNHEDF